MDYKEHIKNLEAQIKKYKEKETPLTEEEEKEYIELIRRLYRSKAKKHCC